MTLLRRIACVVLCGLLSGTAVAAADGDPGAGIQSVFGTGFGNRALAMGSAFVAAGDDASTLSWNPAGLAVLRRPECQLSQSNGLGLGFHETNFALGVPDWRWGTGALSIRNFGIGNLEQRDDRNQLVSTELSDQELEFALGYANTLGPALALGGTLKAQRQSIAGLSAMGVGADAGVRVVPGELLGLDSGRVNAFVFGLAVRNLLRPSLRLDRESVNDPTTFRTGLAWRGLTGVVGNMIAEIDVEHVASGGTALRTGFEARPIAAAALRAGMNGARLTAGAGFQWHGVSFDYAYQDNPIAAEHRMGIAYAFGRDVDESRAAALKKEDDRLQARLDDVYRERQANRIAALMARADSGRASGRYDDALDALASARTLVPDDLHIAQLELAVLKQRAAALMTAGDFTAAALTYDQVLASAPSDSEAVSGARNARRMSDERTARSEGLRARYDRVLDDFGEGRLASARENLLALLAEAPADSDAAGMLRRTDVAIARGIARALDQAGDELRAGRPADALATLKSVDDLDPSTPELAARRAECQRALRAQSATTGTTTGAPTPALVRRPTPAPAAAPAPAVVAKPSMDPGELARLYRRGVESQSQGRFEDAIRCWEMVQASSPGYRGVDQALVREYLTRGMESFSTGHLDEAIRSWEQVLRIDPADTRAQGYLARAREQAARRRQMFGAAQ